MIHFINYFYEFIITDQDEIKKVYIEDPTTGERTEVSEDGGAE